MVQAPREVRVFILVAVVSGLGTLRTADGQTPGTVFPGIEIEIPDLTSDVVRGDLDGDGDEDLFVGTQLTASFVLIADGHGGFATQPVSSALGEALTARLGDLDNDGNLDVVVSGLGSLPMAALGDGHGDFGAAYGVANDTWLQFDLADLNGDGILDLAGGARVSGKVSLWLGTGGGTMVAGAAPVAIHSAPFESRLQDIDGDSDLDLVLAGSYGVRWFANDNQGALLAGADLVANPVTHLAEFLDLNGDNRADLVTAGAAGFLNVRLALPLGGFGASTSYAQGLGIGSPTDSDRGDLDGDGRFDLAVLSSYGASVSVLLSDGSGGFGTPSNHAVESETFDQDVEMFDADGDGDLDLAAADGGITILFNDGSGSFGTQLPAGDEPAGLAAVDFDHDDHVDLVASNGFSQNVSVFRGDGTGAFQTLASSALAGVGGAIAAGDVSGDGHVDLVVLLPTASSFQVLLGNGAGSFAPSAPIATGGEPLSVAVGDVTGDQLPDVVVACSGTDQIRIHRSLGGGAFAAAIAVPAGDGPRDVTLVDLTGDGLNDIAAANFNSGTLTFIRSSGTGAFVAFQHSDGGNKPFSIAASDLNGDGMTDVVTTDPFAGLVVVLLAQAGGGFVAATTYPADSWVAHLALADVDRDGNLDVICSRAFEPFDGLGNTVFVLRGDGTGAFAAPSIHPGGIDPTDLVVADFDEDGRPDAALASYNGVAVLENLLPDCGPIGTYGSGCPGTLATTPSLAVTGCASANASVTLRVSGGPALSNALLFLGTAPASIPLPFGCSLLIAPLFPLSIPLTLAATGEIAFSALLPAAAAGANLDLQAFVIDPAGGGGFGATNGVMLAITGP